MLAINPLVAAPHERLAHAAEKLNQRNAAIDANRALLVLQPLDKAEIHFRLARLLRDEGEQDQAKRHVLEALEQAPRYLAAHQLLLEITRTAAKEQPPSEPTNSPTANQSKPPNFGGAR
jgi:tetratricopeptide (TPR) repeat protein